jgi:peptide deformylase
LAILPILKYPDPRLRMISDPITTFDGALAEFAKDMLATMLAAPGAGLAAPQVDRRLRMVLIDWTSEGEEYGQNVLTLVNPEIVAREGTQLFDEGCLSVHDLTAEVERADTIGVKARTLDGAPLSLTASGRRAVIIQHELDHLDGVLFLDHLGRLQREAYHTRLLRAMRERRA